MNAEQTSQAFSDIATMLETGASPDSVARMCRGLADAAQDAIDKVGSNHEAWQGRRALAAVNTLNRERDAAVLRAEAAERERDKLRTERVGVLPIVRERDALKRGVKKLTRQRRSLRDRLARYRAGAGMAESNAWPYAIVEERQESVRIEFARKFTFGVTFIGSERQATQHHIRALVRLANIGDATEYRAAHPGDAPDVPLVSAGKDSETCDRG